MNVILASKSPRRAEILGKIFETFEILVPDVDETFGNKALSDEIMALSKRKARAVSSSDSDMVIAGDTIVVLDNKVYGKPKNRTDAINMLNTLNGKMHTVLSGICVKYNGNYYCDYDTTRVYFNKLSLKNIEKYVDEYEPYDKAGAYAIQDETLVEKIDGSYYNVMGLPLEKLVELIKKAKNTEDK